MLFQKIYILLFFDTANIILQISGSPLLPSIVSIINLGLKIYTSLAPDAARLGMLYSLSLRVAGRSLRYLDLDDDDW